MPNLPLTLACWDYDRTRPLIDRRVKAEGIDLDFKVMRPRQIFPRMLERQEFQVSELSFASFASLKARGECPFVGAADRAVEDLPSFLRLCAARGRHQDAEGLEGQARRHYRSTARAPSCSCAA